jgi:hypothetical protein
VKIGLNIVLGQMIQLYSTVQQCEIFAFLLKCSFQISREDWREHRPWPNDSGKKIPKEACEFLKSPKWPAKTLIILENNKISKRIF